MRKGIQLLGITLVSAALFASCTKSNQQSIDPNLFAGTWNGVLTCAVLKPQAATIVMTVNGSNVGFTGYVGSGSCIKFASFSGAIQVNAVVFTPQTFLDNCGNTNTMSGSAYVDSSTLTLSESLSGPTLTTNCSFVGTK